MNGKERKERKERNVHLKRTDAQPWLQYMNICCQPFRTSYRIWIYAANLLESVKVYKYMLPTCFTRYKYMLPTSYSIWIYAANQIEPVTGGYTVSCQPVRTGYKIWIYAFNQLEPVKGFKYTIHMLPTSYTTGYRIWIYICCQVATTDFSENLQWNIQ